MEKTMTSKDKAQFAVVGHPNKGKSSIVSTLSRNDNIHISSRSGTTENADYFAVGTQHGSYDLIDTPGFQRPLKVLAWLEKHCDSASQRAATVARFVDDSQCKEEFKDEVALLSPVVSGAAILYVVDGTRPYGSEYEAEMEILRWTGQPSMALINPIENSDHIAEWENALAQYFKSVRVFNPMKADFEKHIELLQTFTHLNPSWSGALTKVIEDLQDQREEQKTQSIHILSSLVESLCRYQTCQKVLSESQAKLVKPALEKQYKAWMKEKEESALQALLQNYAHYQTEVTLEQFDLPPDLFDCDQWFAWGLDKKQLIYAGTAAGAVSGAALDAAVAGSSFMTGAIGGSILGASSAWLSASKLVDLKIKGLPLGGYQACVGPIKNRNFPYVIIGRFIYFYKQISQLNHANRTALEFKTTDFQDKVDMLEKGAKKELHNACARLVKQKPVDGLSDVLRPLFD
jgi:GTPase Era involved in 16S rRNA processing